jgi:hypothetical protein
MKAKEIIGGIISAIKWLGLGILILLGIRQVQRIIKAVKGTVEINKGFIPGNNPDEIKIKNEKNEYVDIKLPGKITNDQVKKAGYGKGGKITVEVKHEKIDLNNLSDVGHYDMGLGTDETDTGNN